MKRLPNNHRPMGYSSNEAFNKSLSKVIYSPLEEKKKWEKADSVGNLLKGGAAQISSEDIKTKGMTGTSYQKTIKGVERTVFYL